MDMYGADGNDEKCGEINFDQWCATEAANLAKTACKASDDFPDLFDISYKWIYFTLPQLVANVNDETRQFLRCFMCTCARVSAKEMKMDWSSQRKLCWIPNNSIVTVLDLKVKHFQVN